jgi:hypothetical protein
MHFSRWHEKSVWECDSASTGAASTDMNGKAMMDERHIRTTIGVSIIKADMIDSKVIAVAFNVAVFGGQS